MSAGTGSTSDTDTLDSRNRSANAQKEVATTMLPRIKNASAPERLSDLNSIAARTAPRFPPAPTIPETDPTARGRTRGTTAKVTPHAMHTNNPRSSNAAVAGPRTVIRENNTISRPSRKIVTPSRRVRPARPHLLPAQSPAIPPMARANRFIIPMRLARSPASLRVT